MDKWSNISSEKPSCTRRHGPDCLQKIMFYLGIFCWLLFIVALILFNYARPEIEFGYLTYLHVDVRDHWHKDLKRLLTYVLWTCSVFSLLTIIINHLRSRRKNDSRWYNIILLLFVTFAALLTIILPL